MKTRMIMSLGLSALVMGGTMVGCTATSGGLASSGSRDAAVAAKLALRDVDRARRALGRGDGAQAAVHAEAAVALMPQNAGYRALLGQSYLKAGRFASAKAAFTDTLSLQPNDGRSALNLALAEIALGDWKAARETLETHAATIAATDRGLALALAGDPAGGVAMLTDVVRSGEATPKGRQNLALAYALAGHWQAARVVASTDMSPADVDRRLEQWAAFAQPRSSSDQVASLLGVRPVQDPGQPVALALSAPVAVGQAVAEAPAPAPVEVAVALPTPAAPVDVKPAEQVRAPAPAPEVRRAPLLRADPRAIKVALTRASAPARGNWFVQVGAFRNAAVARDGWRRATRRMPALAGRTPTGARYASNGSAFYRLAFGGFPRSEADAVCRRYRATGGACFVRAAAGDQIASWAAKPIQLASR
jgi:Flp pilus assembly protein TadD